MKSSIEHVHSQGRVLNDRSVLYKYINPNLVAIATQGPDSIHKCKLGLFLVSMEIECWCSYPVDILNIHLIDVVSGAIVTSLTHRRAKGPIHMVHSENWLVYSYYNDKVRRTEISKANSFLWMTIESQRLTFF